MSLYVSGTVRRILGDRTVAAMMADPPPVVECRICRRGARPLSEAVSVGVVAIGTVSITAWSHRVCAGSRVLTRAQFEAEAVPASLMDDEEKAVSEDPEHMRAYDERGGRFL